MPRSIRTQKNTVFGFGEGESENIVLKYLRSQYAQNRTSITISDAGGGDPNHILKKATGVRSSYSYNYSFILLDTDKQWTETLKKRARELKFELIGSSPCLEGLLLSILEPSGNFDDWPSPDCKGRFKDKYLRPDRMITERHCGLLFPIALLNQARTRIESLRRVIEIMKGNF